MVKFIIAFRATFTHTHTFPSSPKWIRGAVVSLYQWAITFGLLLAAIVNYATHKRDDHSAYRIPISVQFVLALVLAAGMFLLPEVSL